MRKTLDNVFLMDDTSYVGLVVTSLKRGCSVLDGDNAGRMLNGSMTRDIIGSFFTYEMEIDASGCDRAVYDRFYEQVTRADVDSHLCRFAYGQQYLQQRMYVAEVSDTLLHCAKDGNLWGRLNVKFVAMDPASDAVKVAT